MLGPQRGPIIKGRIRAQWKQIDTEHKEALAVRREWMMHIGVPAEEIDELCENSIQLDLLSELRQLESAMELM